MEKRLAAGLAIGIGLLLPLAAKAANVQITGGSNGASCNSGGYFTPSAVSIGSGDTVTISVPSNDPYPAGIEVHGFPGGNFVVPQGGSHTTGAITGNVSFYATWPSSGCMKGSGNVTVNAPAPVPAPSPHPTPTPAPKAPAPAPTPTPSPGSGNQTTTPTTAPSPSPTPTNPSSAQPSAATAQPKSMSLAAKIGRGIGVLLAAVIVGTITFFVIRRRKGSINP